MAVVTLPAGAAKWLRINFADADPVDLELIDGMTMNIDSNGLTVSDHEISFVLDDVTGFHYIEKEDGDIPVAVETIEADSNIAAKIYTLDGKQIESEHGLRELTPGLYIIRYSDRKSVKILMH